MFIFKFFAAMVTADAIDRHLRDQQHRAWADEDERRRASHTVLERGPARSGWDSTLPERPT